MHTRVEISKKALELNIQNYRKLIGEKTLFVAVVKSNAYGHGILEIAKLSLEFGADLLGVNSLEEATLLRKNFPEAKILIMGEVLDREKKILEQSDENFWFIVSRKEEVSFLNQLNPRPKIHLKVDTGMSRLGYSGEAFQKELEEIHRNNLLIDGLMTHFASTEDFTEHSYSYYQLNQFNHWKKFIESLGYKDLIYHASSSASTLLFPDARFDMVRVGISLYGLWASLETRLSLTLLGKDFDLHPVMSWKTRVVHIQDLDAGKFIGYGSTYKTRTKTRVAVIPIGYHEGYNRRLSNQGYVLVRGERAPIVGRVCMNMSMIDITHIPDISIGEEVVIIGRSGKEIISADLLANLSGTINYDIVTSVQKEIPRVIVD